MATKETAQTQNRKTDTAEAQPESLKMFGKDIYLKALESAKKAIHSVLNTDKEIADLELTIATKRTGNATIIFNLACECVTLTAKGKKARLKEAALLLSDVCDYAQEECLAEHNKALPEAKQVEHIRDVVPSWPTLRSVVLNSMRKAEINPLKLKDYGAVEKAYTAFKQKNPQAKDGRGAKVQGGQTEGRTERTAKQAEQVVKDMGAEASKFVKLEEDVKAAVRTLVATLNSVSTEARREGAKRIGRLCQEILALDSADKSSGRASRAPAKPVNVPDSVSAQ